MADGRNQLQEDVGGIGEHPQYRDIVGMKQDLGLLRILEIIGESQEQFRTHVPFPKSPQPVHGHAERNGVQHFP